MRRAREAVSPEYASRPSCFCVAFFQDRVRAGGERDRAGWRDDLPNPDFPNRPGDAMPNHGTSPTSPAPNAVPATLAGTGLPRRAPLSPCRIVAPLVLGVTLGIFALLAPSSLSGQAPEGGGSHLAPLGWMPGCWEGTLSNGARYEEWWMPEAGGLMQGVARMTRDERTITFEFMVLGVEDGNPVFTAQPAGAPAPTRFPLARRDGERWVFENPDHDFPNRVVYANPAVGDAPFARIEGESGGQERSLEFPLARVTCPG